MQRPLCANCKKVQTDIQSCLIHLSDCLVVADIICKCNCGIVHMTGKQVNKRLTIQEPSVIIQPTLVVKKN